MSPLLHRLGRFAARRPWLVVGQWLLVAVLVSAASGPLGRELEDSFAAPGVDSEKATALLSAAGSDRSGLSAQLVVTPRDERATLAAGDPALKELQAEAEQLPRVLGSERTISPDGRVALIRLHYPVLEQLTAKSLDDLKALRADASLRLERGGDLFFAFEEPETGTGELLGLIAAAVVLLVAFGSVVAMGLPIGIALFGLAVAVGALPLVAHLIAIPSWAPELGAMVGLGVGIDYALLLIVRYREFLAAGLEREQAIARAVATAGRVVVCAGGTVVVAILGLAVSGVPMVAAAGVALAMIVLFMVLAAVSLLPALLALAGPWIDRLGLPRRRRARAAGAGWERWGGHVARHPWRYALGTTALLLALAAPVLALRTGNPDEGVLPESRTERRAYDLVADGFGPGRNGPLVIAVDAAGDAGAADRVARAVRADPGIAEVAPPAPAGNGVATAVAYPATGPQDDATRATLARLRADVLPRALDGHGAAHIGGQTASFIDVSDRVEDRLAPFILAVVALSFLLLTVIFRSVVVPLKAAAMNLLSIGAAYGVMVMVFQWGWGAGLIGLESTVPVVSFLPMFMFAILFGLSMDYEVFLLSRIREEYLASGDNHAAIVRGLAGTGRVITSAALIMVCVFLGFVVSVDPTTKMFGLGLAVAILLDATAVRMVLVPATMTLLGHRNWWLPRRLERRLPAFAGERTPLTGRRVEGRMSP
jgi:RND superfamily putative drug exporter